MLSAKRTKRDSPENIYRHCKVTGTCPPDVENKIENKTWADVLLQAFSSIIFLGNLGIGTGKGSLSGGVRPVPGGRVVPESIAPTPTPARPSLTRPSVTRPSRPFSVPLDTIGVGSRPVDPIGRTPIDVIDPSSPAVVTLSEASPDTVITLGEGTVPELEIITDTSSIGSHPTVFQSPDNGVAILNVSPGNPPPTKVYFSIETQNPIFESTIGHIEPTYDVHVNPFVTTETITFGEEIPLEPITPRSEFEIEDIPKTSTPVETLGRALSKVKGFYKKTVQQVPTRNPNLLGDVSRAIEFGFENPAFDPEVSLQFEEDVNEVRAAPDPDFTGIQRISRPYLTATEEGKVRVSRLGSRAGIRTRKGTVIGQDVHLFYDISTIEEIELPTIQSLTSSVIEPSTTETFIGTSESLPEMVSDLELLDTYTENFTNAHLVLPVVEEDAETSLHPFISPSTFSRPVIVDIGNGYFYSAENTSHPNISPSTPTIPLVPGLSVNIYSSDFLLHPSLLGKRKRKRSDSF
uniref:Minor capsid protein L2 n=1 Tax=Human papillomavirus TaxID=10566 RepID=A0A385PKL1_9PAPI|nr:MAG: L2 protein [Human papillomavirus]